MTNKWRAGILTTTLTPLSSRRPQCQSWHSISSVLSCPARTLWPLPVDQHLQQPDHGPLCPQWCQSQLIPALGGGVTAIASSCPDSTWHPPQGWASSWAAWAEDARGWPGTCRPAPHFPEGPVAWPGMGSQSQEGRAEQGGAGEPNRMGWGGRLERLWPLLCTAAARGGYQLPFPLPLPFSSTQAPKSSSPCGPLPQPQASLSQPRPAQESQGSFTGGSHDSGVWLGMVSIRFCGGVRCCMCSCKNVHDHVCDRDHLG